MSDHDFCWSCNRRALKSALDRLKKTFNARSTIPVLSQLEVIPDPFSGGALLRVTDLESHHSIPIPGMCSGDVLMVDFRKLVKIVDALPEGQITIRGDALPPVEYHDVEKEIHEHRQIPRTETVNEMVPRPNARVIGALGKKSFSLFRWDHLLDGNALPDFLVCSP